jgi:hypothetical protein
MPALSCALPRGRPTLISPYLLNAQRRVFWPSIVSASPVRAFPLLIAHCQVFLSGLRISQTHPAVLQQSQLVVAKTNIQGRAAIINFMVAWRCARRYHARIGLAGMVRRTNRVGIAAWMGLLGSAFLGATLGMEVTMNLSVGFQCMTWVAVLWSLVEHPFTHAML